jgi:hypothetical protein
MKSIYLIQLTDTLGKKSYKNINWHTSSKLNESTGFYAQIPIKPSKQED